MTDPRYIHKSESKTRIPSLHEQVYVFHPKPHKEISVFPILQAFVDYLMKVNQIRAVTKSDLTVFTKQQNLRLVQIESIWRPNRYFDSKIEI